MLWAGLSLITGGVLVILVAGGRAMFGRRKDEAVATTNGEVHDARAVIEDSRAVGDPAQIGDGRAGGGSAEISPSDSGVHALYDTGAVNIRCDHCEGRGYVMRTVPDLLGDSLVGVTDAVGDAMIREFYSRLLVADEGRIPADKLVPLFPPDLLGDDKTEQQRDRLWVVIKALATTYRPGDAGSMKRLNTALDTAGTHHALFWRPAGPPRGATKEEYAAVGDLFIGVLYDFCGTSWRPEWGAAWEEAYGYAADQMFARGQRAVASGEVTEPRYPRSARQVRP